MTSFDVCSKINKSDDRHPQPLDAQSWYLCKKESLGIMFDKWKSKAFAGRIQEAPEPSKAHVSFDVPRDTCKCDVICWGCAFDLITTLLSDKINIVDSFP